MHFYTHYNFQLLQDFTRFTLLRSKKNNSRLPFVLCCSIVVYLAYFILLYFYGFQVLLTILCVTVFLMDLLVLYVYFFSTRLARKRNPALFSSVNEYEFESRAFTVKTVGDAESAPDRVNYDSLLKVVELPKTFYLFLTFSTGYILNKEEMTAKECGQVRALLSAKCKKTYFVKKH